ncbi:carboxypeptidase-like regulatory domain-containing protein [Lacinutrix salivirga]
MKTVLTFCLIFFTALVFSQEFTKVEGVVVNVTNNEILESVNIVNLNQVIGTTTNKSGEFELRAKPNDTLIFSYIGFKSIKVRVTNDWIKYGKTEIGLTELALALEEVALTEFKLTGYLEIDIKQVPVNDNYRYSISGLSNGYEAGNRQPNAISKVLGSILNPLDFLYNTFSKKGREMKKLKKMKQDDDIRNLLASRFDREMLTVLLEVNKVDLEEIISQCNYSKEFIATANDLQVLDAISECYEEYKILSKSRTKI